ncbi:MAG: hypothetical protein ACLPKB_22840 [Xanthobacteraceae bacterium]
MYRHAYAAKHERINVELDTAPLTSPTGPNGAPGFHNVAGSQITVPQVTNVYVGAFWGDQSILESFSKAILENGYLDPLRELGYGTGPGVYLGSVDDDPISNGTIHDTDIRARVIKMLDGSVLHADANSLFMLLLPTGVTVYVDRDGNESCASCCGYHDAFPYQGIDVAYGVIPSPVGCNNCGNGDLGYFTAAYVHELVEACTDKVPGKGWIAADGQEASDLEAWHLFGWGPPSDNRRFVVQGYYTNERGNTIGAWRDAGDATVA